MSRLTTEYGSETEFGEPCHQNSANDTRIRQRARVTEGWTPDLRADFLLGGAQELVGQRLRLTGYQVALIGADRLLNQVFVAPTRRAFLRVRGGQLSVRWSGVDFSWDQRTSIRDTRAPLQEQGS